MSAGRILVLCMIARIFFVVCCVVLVFSRFGRSELKNPIIATPPTYKQNFPPVIEAAFKGDVLALKQLLADDANPNVRSFDNSTGLTYACRNGDDDNAMRVIYELFKYGARGRVTNNLGLAPIHQMPAISRFKNRDDVIHQLFLHGADLNVYNYKQEAGLNSSFNTYDSKAGVVAVDLKAPPRARYTMLDMTVNNYDRTGVIDLLENWGGLIPLEERKRSRTLAYDIGFRDIADAIGNYDESKGGWRKNLMNRGILPIMIGALTNDVALVKKEIKDINKLSSDAYRRPPLHMAVMRQHPEMVELLLNNGAYVAAKDYQGNTALHHVAWLGDIILQKKLTELLLQHKASLRALNDRKENILHYAIRLGDLPYIQYLMSTFKPEDLGLDDKTIKGLTPYYLAEKVNFTEAMKILPKR